MTVRQEYLSFSGGTSLIAKSQLNTVSDRLPYRHLPNTVSGVPTAESRARQTLQLSVRNIPGDADCMSVSGFGVEQLCRAPDNAEDCQEHGRTQSASDNATTLVRLIKQLSGTTHDQDQGIQSKLRDRSLSGQTVSIRTKLSNSETQASNMFNERTTSISNVFTYSRRHSVRGADCTNPGRLS